MDHCRPVTVASSMITSTIHLSIHEPRRHLSLLHRLVSAGCSVPVSPNRPVDRLLVSAPLSSGGTPTYGRQLTSAPGAKESRRKTFFLVYSPSRIRLPSPYIETVCHCSALEEAKTRMVHPPSPPSPLLFASRLVPPLLSAQQAT